jgi:hypothetical protein
MARIVKIAEHYIAIEELVCIEYTGKHPLPYTACLKNGKDLHISEKACEEFISSEEPRFQYLP